MKDHTAKLKEFHELYCSLTLRQVTFDMPALYRWEQWSARQWTIEDLHLVISYIKKKIQAGERKPESLRLHNLIDTSRFEDDLVDARGRARGPRIDREKASVLRSTGREPDRKEKPVDSAAAAIERTKLASMLKEWKEKNL